MFDKAAIDTLAQAQAITAAKQAIPAELDLLALPDNFKLSNLEKYLPLRRRARGTMTTELAEAFGAYVKAHAEQGASIFIDQDKLNATAVLNLGTPAAPGHADNTAKLQLRQTAAYKAMAMLTQGHASQTTLAEFLEDWRADLQCFGADPEPTEGDEDLGPALMTVPRAIAAVRKVTIDAARKTESTEKQLGASRSALESVTARSGDNPLPAFIHFNFIPYHGLPPRVFVMRVGVVTSADKPAFVLRVVNPELHAEQMAAELVSLIGTRLGLEQPCLIGAYSAKD